MWIIPKNHPLSCHCAQDMEDSKKVLSQSLENAPFSLMWRSKPSQLRTWLIRWKRERWMQYLSGRILKPSMQNHFEDVLISSLADIRASRSVLQEKGKRKKTRDIYGHSSEQLSYMPDPDKFFSKMYWDIYHEGSPKSSKIWKVWATQLRLEYSQRLKSAQLIKGNECLSWPTPTICGNYNKKGASQNSGDGLSTAVKNWSTPDCSDRRSDKSKQQGLSNQVKNWGTPRVTTNGGCPSPQCTGKGSRLEDQVSMWPTITAAASIQGENIPDGKRGIPLINAVRENWTTSATRDYKNVGAQGSFQERKKSHAQPLPEVVINGQHQEDVSNGNGKNQGLWWTPNCPGPKQIGSMAEWGGGQRILSGTGRRTKKN